MEKKSLFHFDNYRAYLRFYLDMLPRSRGALKLWTEHLNVHSTLVSQVMIGKRDFSEEQTLDLSEFLATGPLKNNMF